MSTSRVTDRFLIRLTLVWLAILGFLPWLHDRQATFVASLALPIANFCFTLRTLTCQRRVPVLLNFMQILLFAVLNYQLYVTYGEEHYVLDRDPGFFDWAEFA